MKIELKIPPNTKFFKLLDEQIFFALMPDIWIDIFEIREGREHFRRLVSLVARAEWETHIYFSDENNPEDLEQIALWNKYGGWI